MGATWLKCNFFFLQICNEVPREKKKRGPVASPTGDRPLSPTPGATGSPVSILQIGTIASVLFYSKILFRNSIVQANPLKHWPPFAAIPFVI